MEMKNIRKAAAAVLTAALLTAGVFAEGLTFIDVPEDEWYYADVEKAVSSGLISGKSEEIYAPDDFLTLAEAVKLAACMNELYTAGAVTLAPGDPWYAPYVAYASENGIIDSDDGYSWNETASRAEFAEIFARALPDEALAAINAVADGSIPDVGDETSGKDAIYSLYRAGVLTGSDDQHSFRPDDNIKRSEVAAIVTRMMDEESRQSFSLGEAAQKIVKAYDYVGSWGDKWSGRAFMDILPGEYPKYSVTLRWSSSYNSAGVWSMTAVFNEETKRLEYADGEMAYVTYSEDGSVESTEIEWSDAEGWLAINENGGLDWNDSREERCSEMIFERYEYYPIEQSEIIDSYFRLIGGFAPDESGSSLKRARAARDAVKFASENNIWTRDVGQLRDSLLEAWESLDEADQLAFDANFIDICRLIDDCREDWKESSGLFADAGISDMEKLLLDEKAMLSWSVLASNTLTLGNSDGI